MTDEQTVADLATLLENALPFYEQLTGIKKDDGLPLPVYYFASYAEWAAYTRATTGADAPIYLRVFNGGYTIGERVVIWQTTPPDVLSTAAHEGMHQFVARHFSRRLPPVIEEGLGVACENVDLQKLSLRQGLTPRRSSALRDAVAGQYLIPLDTFLKLHAGDVSDRPAAIREAFYGQSGALVMFLESHRAYRDGFHAMLAACAAGTATVDVGVNRPGASYNAGLSRALIETYLPFEWTTLLADFDRWTARQ